jgi:ribosomal protein S18 acetylase RimI-like enzyme
MMVLRPASLDDMPALAELGRSSFSDAFAHLYKPSDLTAFLEQVYTTTAVTVDFENPNLVYCLAEDDRGLAGYCKIAVKSSFAEHSNAARPMALNQLYIASDRTGQGIGAQLMDWALGAAHDHRADAMQLSVYSENYGAQRFYQRYGFAKIADVGFWVGTQRDAEFLYELRLD